METELIVGIAWYRREDYPRMLQIVKDPDDLPSTYDEWLRSAKKVERRMRRSSLHVVHTYIDPDALLAWCVFRGLEPNGEARARYCSDETARSRAER